MSGFVAAVKSTADPTLPGALQKMSKTLAHRGDREYTKMFSDHCGIAARFREQSGFRVDTYSDPNHGVAFDGLLFNKSELADLVGTDRSIGIAQLVLRGFEKFGNSFFAKLDGSFALMLANLRENEITLVRDRFGHRPLYFGTTNGDTWVGSELKAILNAPGFHRSINENALTAAIGYGITPGPETLFSDIYKCVPGFVFTIGKRCDYRASNYFAPTIQQKTGLGLAEAKDFVQSNLEQAVRRYVAECPGVGVLLSGGVDSALLAHHLAEASNTRSAAISFGAASWPEEESADAGEVAKQVGLEFSRTYVSPQDNLLESLRNTILHLEEPTRFENGVALEITCREAAGNCTGLLTGEAADVILGSNEHHSVRRISQVQRLPKFLRAAATSVPQLAELWGPLRSLARYSQFSSIEDHDRKSFANCLDLVPNAQGPAELSLGSKLHDIVADWPPAAQYTYTHIMGFQHCWIERMEKIASASAMECFHPFQNNEMLHFGLELPDQLRKMNGVTKPIARELAADYFGNSFAHRKKKQLAAPMGLWLTKSQQLRESVMQLKSPNCRIRAYLDNDAVDKYLRVYEEQGAESGPTSRYIFRMLSFELWLEMFGCT